MKQHSGPAFPASAEQCNRVDAREGMSLWDWYVGVAIQGMLANPGGPIQYSPQCGWGMTNCNEADVVDTAHEIADAVISKREK